MKKLRLSFNCKGEAQTVSIIKAITQNTANKMHFL